VRAGINWLRTETLLNTAMNFWFPETGRWVDK